MQRHLTWLLSAYLTAWGFFILRFWWRHRSWSRSLRQAGWGLLGVGLMIVIPALAYFSFPASIRERAERLVFTDWRDDIVTLNMGDRRAQLFVPKREAPIDGRPLLLVLHGFASNAPETFWYLDIEPMVDRYNMLAVVPDGTVDKKGKRFWNATEVCCNFDQSSVDDVRYLAELLATVKDQYAINAQRVYVLGHSNGGYMAYRLACEHPELFRGLVSIAGAGSGQEAQCEKSQALSVLQIHGDWDQVVSYDAHDRKSPSAPRTAELWASHMDCAEPSTELKDVLDLAVLTSGQDTDTRTWENCREGHRVALWTIHQASHVPLFTEQLLSSVWHFLDGDKFASGEP